MREHPYMKKQPEFVPSAALSPIFHRFGSAWVSDRKHILTQIALLQRARGLNHINHLAQFSSIKWSCFWSLSSAGKTWKINQPKKKKQLFPSIVIYDTIKCLRVSAKATFPFYFNISLSTPSQVHINLLFKMSLLINISFIDIYFEITNLGSCLEDTKLSILWNILEPQTTILLCCL